MKAPFSELLELLLCHEGGFVNHSADPGGMTNLGVTRRAWETYLGHPVTEAEMRALTPEAVAPFYHSEYYVKCGADRLPAGLDHATMDFAVNSGVGKAVKFLQGAVGTAADGHFGPATLAAAEKADAGSAIRYLCDSRLVYLKGLENWPTFGDGWEKRVKAVKGEALDMVDGESTPLVS